MPIGQTIPRGAAGLPSVAQLTLPGELLASPVQTLISPAL
jgi:hypothetical protein